MKTPEITPAPTDAPRAEERDDSQARWNYRALMLDVTFFTIGQAFLEPVAVIPLLLAHLGASGPMIGAYAALSSLLFNLPQVFVAYALHNRPRQKPFLARVAAVSRLPFLLLPLVLWRADASPSARLAALMAAIFLLVLWSCGDGTGYVPWMEIVARAFSERTRGRFFARSSLLSGVASLGVAFLAERILASSRLPFPHNFAVLALLSAVCVQVSLTGVLLLREPPALIAAPVRPPFADYFRRLPALLRANPIFLRLAVVQLLVGFGGASSRFYVLYAVGRFHLRDAWGGTYQLLQAVSLVALMPLLAFLNERFGLATGVRAIAFICLLTPLAALTVGALSPWLFGLVFLLLGGSLNWGMWIAFNHYLLSHVADEERPLFIALLNLLLVPSAFYPLIGGQFFAHGRLALMGGVPILFVLTAGVIFVGFALALRLPAPDPEAA